MATNRGGRTLTPVQVLYFPKKPARAPARITQTIPEVSFPVAPDDLGAHLDAAASAEGRRGGRERAKKRSSSGASHARVTLSDEAHRDAGDGLSHLAILGHELFTQGRVQEARAIFEGLVVSSETDGFARTMLGTICLALNDFDRALILFEAALLLDPTDVAALVYRGEIKLERKKVRHAIADFEKAIELGESDDPFADRARRLLKLARKPERR